MVCLEVEETRGDRGEGDEIGEEERGEENGYPLLLVECFKN
jgi:hypothetical protein